ncbi:MAG: hypothetical protein GY765_20500 [bacterium]|nr:hypothetical protein [bacterium]
MDKVEVSNNFVEKVRQSKSLIKELQNLEVNNWKGLKTIAADTGFTLDEETLKETMPEEFFAALGWDLPKPRLDHLMKGVRINEA